MITYVNTVLVGAGNGVVSANPADATSKNTASADAGKYIVTDSKGTVISTAANAAAADQIKVGMVTKKNVEFVNHTTGAVTYKPIIKWSNVIKKADIKSYNELTYAADTEDVVTIDLTGATLADLANKRIVVRLTFKDLPTRFRKWTESYEYVVKSNDTLATIASSIASDINKQYKRARVVADGTTTSGKIVITAMPYDDDDTVDSISPANKVRFSATMWMTDPAAEGFASKNKYAISGVHISKVEGKQYAASAKLVRDLEAGSLGYQGIINHGEGTWPIIKPEMATDLSAHYNGITLEFENMYRTADDLQRKTKQALNIFDTDCSAIQALLEAFVSGKATGATLADAQANTSDAE